MNENQHTMSEIQELLHAWRGSNISVTKKELGDIDTITMVLEDFQVEKRPPTIDDYIGEQLIRLIGNSGKISTDNKMEDLPQDRYEIPLEGVRSAELSAGQINLEMERGVYILQKAD